MTWWWILILVSFSIVLSQALKTSGGAMLGWGLFTCGLLLDLFTVYRNARRLRVEHSPSGIPVLSLILYLFALQASPEGSLFFGPWQDLFFVVFLHVIFQFVIPLFDCWILRKLGRGNKFEKEGP
jgi:hypothetical protein